jgi:hypothetical protein
VGEVIELTTDDQTPIASISTAGERFQLAHRCHRIKTNGDRCGSPARRGSEYCHFHQSVSRPRAVCEVPVPEDGNAIQLGIYTMIQALLDERLDRKTANSVLYALQIAKTNLKNVDLNTTDSVDPDLEQPAA